jgi:predicted ATPase
LISVEEAMNYSAVQLFVSRARTRQQGFMLREQDLKAVCDICRRLDGLPLAIELAVTQIDALALVGLQAQLGNCLQLLSHGRRTAVPRHRTLKAALDWGYQGLNDAEQLALQRLSVFPKAFTLDDALVVVTCTNLPAQVLVAVVAQLVAKSLLCVERGSGIARYRMLNTTRSYAREQWLSQAQRADIEQRHARYKSRASEIQLAV